MNSTPRSCHSLSYHAAASMNSARAERRNSTERLIAGCELAPSPSPHSKGLHHRDWPHAPKAAGRVQPSALPWDPVRHFARRCCPKALRPIQSVLPQIVGELGRIKTHSLPDYCAQRRPELTTRMRRYSRGSQYGYGHVITPETPRKLGGDFAASPKYHGGRSWYEGALAFEIVVPFFEGFKKLVRTF